MTCPALVAGFGPEWVGAVGDDAGQVRRAAVRRRGHRSRDAGRIGEHAGAHRQPAGGPTTPTSTAWSARWPSGRRVERAMVRGFGRHRARRRRRARRARRPAHHRGRPQRRQGVPISSIWPSACGADAQWCDIDRRAAWPTSWPAWTWWSTPCPPTRSRPYASTLAAAPVLLDAIYDPWPTPLASAVAIGGRPGDQRPGDAAEPGFHAGRAVHRPAGSRRGDEGRAAAGLAWTGGEIAGNHCRPCGGPVAYCVERVRYSAASPSEPADSARRCR